MLTEADIKTLIFRDVFRQMIMVGSDLLRDYGYSQNLKVYNAVQKLKEEGTVYVLGPLLDSDIGSVYRVTLSISPNKRNLLRLNGEAPD